MHLEDLGIIGNCQYSALVRSTGAVVWCCLPRFDAEPIFSSLLDDEGGGSFAVGSASGTKGIQRYLPNTNVLETTFASEDGAFRVTDFAPRFLVHGRFFRPTWLVRVLDPVKGAPSASVRCDPRLGWSKAAPSRVLGSHHVGFEGLEAELRLTTDIPLSYLDGRPFALTERRHLLLAWGEPATEDLPALCDRCLGETVRYWQKWVKHCNVPAHFQAEVIRSALALKLHCYEDTGAIIAAMTTSIPEAKGSGRTWDYRYCWLRDAYYALSAFQLLGHFEEREGFVHFLLNLAAGDPALDLKPLYRVDGRGDLSERILSGWPGYEGEGPVRAGNQATEHRQNNVYGEMVLALAPVFLDERFVGDRSREALGLLDRLARKAVSVAGTPDAGIWEFRTGWRPQTFSSLMCWAGADRMARVAACHRPEDASELRSAADRLREEILAHAWNGEHGTFVASLGGDDLDASLLQIVTLGLLPPSDPRLHRTVDRIRQDLGSGGWLLRYRSDEFGQAKVAFILCTFWLVQALACLGRRAEAEEVFDRARSALSPLGLLSEDYETSTLRMWGNFPQAYSHVGLIHAAFAASPPWSEVV